MIEKEIAIIGLHDFTKLLGIKYIKIMYFLRKTLVNYKGHLFQDI